MKHTSLGFLSGFILFDKNHNQHATVVIESSQCKEQPIMSDIVKSIDEMGFRHIAGV